MKASFYTILVSFLTIAFLLEEMKLTTMKVQALGMFVLLLVVGTSSLKSDRCPFNYLYHFGDTTTDIGNSVLIKPWGPHLPAAHPPYGMTYPGYPTGRWCDGRIDFDYTAADYGLPNIVPYLGLNIGSTEYDGIMFSVARSPVLDRSFFEARGIEIPPFCVSLNGQMNWFKEHINTIAPTPEAVAERLKDSVMFMGDLEGNDVIYGLTQGKSFEEVKTYVPYIVEAQVNVIRELIAMGAWRFMFPGNLPILGCTPYLLTELPSNNPNDYDEQGCLNTINELVQYKNRAVQEAIANLKKEFPDVFILYIGGNQEAVRSYLKAKSSSDPETNIALKACCGVGGRYNFDSKRFCGSPEATVCSNPGDYVWWDGMHFTQETYRSLVEENMPFALRSLNCTTSQLSASM